jgi:hypothetical protein
MHINKVPVDMNDHLATTRVWAGDRAGLLGGPQLHKAFLSGQALRFLRPELVLEFKVRQKDLKRVPTHGARFQPSPIL